MGGITDILIIGMVGLGAIYILKNPQILQGQPAAPVVEEPVAEVPVEPIVPAASQITCSDGSVIASTETCPDAAAADDAAPEEEDEDKDNEDDDNDDDNDSGGGDNKSGQNAKQYTKSTTSAQRQVANKKIEAMVKRNELVKKRNAAAAKHVFARIDEDNYTPLNWG